jgi:hypothetical protein
MAPSEFIEHLGRLLVKAAYIHGSCYSFHTCKLVWLAVVYRVGCDQVGYCRDRCISQVSAMRNRVFLHILSFGERIFAHGNSSSLAQEHSTTAVPASCTRSESAGETTWVPFGDKTTPRKRCPTRSSDMRFRRASFLPLQRFGSQWSKSCNFHKRK